jgi:hypothetical protein
MLKLCPLMVAANIANKSSMVLKWSTAKIVFSDPDLGPKWPPLADIVLT